MLKQIQLQIIFDIIKLGLWIIWIQITWISHTYNKDVQQLHVLIKKKVEVSWYNEYWIAFELHMRKQSNFIVEWWANYWEYHEK
jgi:hypothetical protein